MPVLRAIHQLKQFSLLWAVLLKAGSISFKDLKKEAIIIPQNRKKEPKKWENV